MPYNLDIAGWMGVAELQHIENLAQTVPENGLVVEVGSWHGRSSWAWANSIPKSATLHCIDVWPENTLEIFLTNTKDCKNISIHRTDSCLGLASLLGKQCDIIFLDGSHKNPEFMMELQLSQRLLKNGGILCGHDFHSLFPDVVNEVRNFSAKLNKPVHFCLDSSIWRILF